MTRRIVPTVRLVLPDAALDILRNCSFFNALSAGSLGSVRACAVMKHYARGAAIFRQGDACPGLFVVGGGTVRVFKLAPNGKEHVLHFAEPGRTFAEVAVLGGFACPANAEAIEDTNCVLLPSTPFRALLARDHDICRQLLTSMSLWVRQLVGLLEDVVLRDATARVARHLLQADDSNGVASFTLPMAKKDLASHLNLTSETLSRTLRRLAEAGLIALGEQNTLRLLRVDALRDTAEGLPPGEWA